MGKKQKLSREDLEKRLRNSMFVVAGGAWQRLWELEESKVIGFNSAAQNEVHLPSQEELKSSIHSELLQRFRSEISVMSPMSKEDYELAMEAIYQQLTPFYQQSFSVYYNQRIDEAVSKKLGMRYFEEVISKTLTKPLCDIEEPEKEELQIADPF
jgi:hypothetical protein